MLQNVKYCEDVSCGKLLLPGERYLEYKGRCFCHFACLQRATMLHFRIDEVIRKNAPPHKESITRIGSDPLPPDYRIGANIVLGLFDNSVFAEVRASGV
jgi:hypothetical protein